MALGKLPEADLEGGEEAIFAEINITPLTDLFLVMLIIFMVSASAAIDQVQRRHDAYQDQAEEQKSGLKVDLPTGSAQEIDTTSAILVVVITAKGELAVNDQPIAKDHLEKIFRSVYAMNQNTQVVIRADTSVYHGKVVEVMEAAKRAGLTRLAIQTSSGGR